MNIAKRQSYVDAQTTLDASKLVFVDESGVMVGMNRLYGWSPRGEQAVIARRTKGKRLNLIGGMALDGERGLMEVDGSVNKERIAEFMTEHLVLNPGDIVVMDNASVHTALLVREAIEGRGASVLYLPPYCPEFNPIEHLWSTLKAGLRAAGSRAWSELRTQVAELWRDMDAAFFPNWVENCGYATGAST